MFLSALLNWCKYSNFFKLTVLRSDFMKWNYQRCIFNFVTWPYWNVKSLEVIMIKILNKKIIYQPLVYCGGACSQSDLAVAHYYYQVSSQLTQPSHCTELTIVCSSCYCCIPFLLFLSLGRKGFWSQARRTREGIFPPNNHLSQILLWLLAQDLNSFQIIQVQNKKMFQNDLSQKWSVN